MNPKQYRGCLVVASLATQLALAAAPAQAQSSTLGVDPSEAEYPVVITPTRLRQSLADVPASVTIITAETMRRHGVTSIVEAMRLVPGMEVTQLSGNSYSVNYHGTQMMGPRRLNVSVDGVTIYRPGLSMIDWTLLPVALEDVDRIEVIRGTDSSAYGPNSMMAVVNILTKHPRDVERGLVSTTVGSHGLLDTAVRVGTVMGTTHVRATADTQHQSGYDDMSFPGEVRNGTHVNRLNVRAQNELADGSSLDLQAYVARGMLTIGYYELGQVGGADSRVDDARFSGRWTKAFSATHELQVNAFRTDSKTTQHWLACDFSGLFQPDVVQYVKEHKADIAANLGGVSPNALGTFVFSRAGLAGLSLSCGNANNDGSESRSQVELQDTYVVSDALRFVTGLGVRYQRAFSQTYFGGAVSDSVRWAFGHAEWRPLTWLTANVGGYGEANSLSGSTFSPRVALNTKLSENQTVRMVVSKGTRTPDLFESRANWSYTLTDLTPPVNGLTTAERAFAAKSPGNLSSEHVFSRELGYLLTSRSTGLTLDARVFDDRLSNLVSGHIGLLDFSPTNQGQVRLTGAELQTTWSISPTWSVWLNYGYLINRDAGNGAEISQYSRHSGAAGVSHALSDDWQASLAHYGSSGDGPSELSYSRTDLTFVRALHMNAHAGSVSVGLSYLDTPVIRVDVGASGVQTASYRDQLALMAQFRIGF